MPANPRDFLLNTDYEMDKIIYYKNGEITPGQTIGVVHHLPFAPLVVGITAFNSDFSDARITPFNRFTDTGTISCQFWANDTYITIQYINTDSSTQKLYYRLYAFEPSTSAATIDSNNNLANKFILNTDYNYCKLFEKGTVSGNQTVTHNLGYIPLVLAWGGSLLTPSWYNTDSDYISVTTTTVEFHINGPAHYRIYCDEV